MLSLLENDNFSRCWNHKYADDNSKYRLKKKGRKKERKR